MGLCFDKNNNIESLIVSMANKNLTVDVVYDCIKYFGPKVRSDMHFMAIFMNYNNLAKKIEIANERIKAERIELFIDSVVNGNSDEFLSKLSWIDKIFLKADLQYFEGFGNLSAKLSNYIDIINRSILDDVENQALNDGFDSVESWQKNNVLKANAAPFHIKKISVGHMRQNSGKQFKFR